MVRSLENFPELATFRIAFCDQSTVVGIQLDKLLIALQIRLQVGQMHVVIAIFQKCVDNRTEATRLISAEMIG